MARPATPRAFRWYGGWRLSWKLRHLCRSGMEFSFAPACGRALDAGLVEVAPGRPAGGDSASPSGFSSAGGALDGGAGVVGAARLAPVRDGSHFRHTDGWCI